MTAEELRAKLARLKEPVPAGMKSMEQRRLEVIAAERDVTRFLQGVHPPSDLAATKLAEIIVREGLSFEEVGKGYFVDPAGFESACRNPWQRFQFKLGRRIGRALET